MSWLDELEARLERQLETFLQANPEQEALLADQATRDRLELLRRNRLELQQQAEVERQSLLELAVEIRQWQERVERARSAGAAELAQRAEGHVSELMDKGRLRWQVLGALGQRFSAVEWELSELSHRPVGGAAGASEAARGGPAAAGRSGPSAGLEQAWTAFESQQELEELRRRLQL
jgi:hercynine metabolism protein